MVSELNSLKINSGWGKTSFGGEASSVLQEVRIVCLEIPSEMEVAPHYTLLTLMKLFTLFILLKLLYTATTLACMPVYIVREG